MPKNILPNTSENDESFNDKPKRRKMVRVSTSNTDNAEENESIANSQRLLEQCGVIERIVLRNVFCHEHLDFDGFTPHVNLFQGANGSGKSSIVAAIIAGLGGSSKATDRGKNLTSLIQHGKQWASIEIYLRNYGCNSYKPEIYGKTIIVERRLNMNGSNSYKLKSENGQIVSMKKEDLNRILDRFNFQVDNPVLILSQERAKTFLSSTNPRALFEFFMTSTQLKQCNDSLKAIKKDVETSSVLVSHKKESLEVLEKEVKECQKKVQAINSLEAKREKVSQLLRAKAWAEIIEEEQEVSRLQNENEILKSQSNKLTKAIERVETKRQELSSKNSTSNSELIKLAEKTKHLESERKKALAEVDEVKKKLRLKLHEKKELGKEILEKERDVSILKNKLEKDNNDATTLWEANMAKLNKEKEHLQEQIRKIDECLETEQAHLQNFTVSLQEAEEDYHHGRLEEKAIKDRLAHLQTEFNNIKQQKDNLSVFGQYMPNVVREINNATAKGQFRDQPIGPIGSYIKVRNKDWIHILEKVAKNLLSSFLVSSRQDLDRLNQIFNNTIPRGTFRPQIIVSSFRNKVHDVRRFETGTDQYFSMWSIIQTDNVQVANTLLDQLQVESILLIPTVEEAMNLLSDKDSVPKNCKKAMTLHGDTIHPDPDYRVYSGYGDKTVRFLQISVEDRIRDLEKNILNTRDEVKRTVSDTLQKKTKFELLNDEKNKSKMKLNKHHASRNTCMKNMQELKNREDPPPPDVFQLQNDLAENENLKKQVEEKLSLVKKELLEGRNEYDEAQGKLNDCRKESEKLKKVAQECETTTSQIEQEFKQAKRELMAYGNKKEELTNHYTKNLQLLEEKEKIVETKTKEITNNEEFRERINIQKSKKDIERELNALRTALESEESRYGDLATITENWRAKRKRHDEVKKELKSQEYFIVKMTKSLQNRMTQLKSTKKMYGAVLRSSFVNKIIKRNLAGKIDVDFNAETLNIGMKKITGNPDTVCHDLKMLSGGERSFATVSFVLSLWDIITSPIRIMDEFDIFMDVVSRNQCVQMIIQSVKNEVQYLIVSPLEYRIQSDKVNIFRMPTPEREKMKENRNQVNE